MIDAVDRGVYMLRKRPKNNRKVILLVSETRDQASEMRLREALIDANLMNVLIYTVDITQLAVRLTEKQPDPRPTPRDPTTMNNPLGIPNTPTTMEQNYGMGNRAQFVPLLKETSHRCKGPVRTRSRYSIREINGWTPIPVFQAKGARRGSAAYQPGAS